MSIYSKKTNKHYKIKESNQPKLQKKNRINLKMSTDKEFKIINSKSDNLKKLFKKNKPLKISSIKEFKNLETKKIKKSTDSKILSNRKNKPMKIT
jgi:hypothetical protein